MVRNLVVAQIKPYLSHASKCVSLGLSGTELRVQKRAARRANSAGRSLGPKGRPGAFGAGNDGIIHGPPNHPPSKHIKTIPPPERGGLLRVLIMPYKTIVSLGGSFR